LRGPESRFIREVCAWAGSGWNGRVLEASGPFNIERSFHFRVIACQHMPALPIIKVT
jgi:hypothetical protein